MKPITMVNPYKTNRARRAKKLLLIFSITSLLAYFGYNLNKSIRKIKSSSNVSTSFSTPSISSSSSSSLKHPDNNKATSMKKSSTSKTNLLSNLTEMESKCPSFQSKPSKPKESWSKPIWFASGHHSLQDGIFKNLIQYVTQMNAGGKSFYASSKGTLRHCISTVSETAACSISDTPTKNFNNYHDKYILYLRSPTFDFPYSTNMKNIKYHGLEGQMDIEQWRITRDEWLDVMIDGWMKHITDWKKTQYTLGTYVVYEDLMDYEKGPEVLKKISHVLNDGGFDTVQSDDELRCAWLMTLGKENIMRYYEKGYEFENYIPGYKSQQKQTMITRFTHFMNEIGDSDKELASILKAYIKDMEDNIVIDE